MGSKPRRIALSVGSNQDWNTPRDVLDPLHAFKPISLDPCSNPTSVVGAAVNLTQAMGDGLYYPWHLYDHTYFNPEYWLQAAWLSKAVHERQLFGADTITALIPAAVETDAFREYVFGTADAIAFWKRRVRFVRGDGKAVSGNAHPSALVYWGDEAERFREHFRPHATVITEWTR